MSSLYDISVPVLNKILNAAITILERGEQHATSQDTPDLQLTRAALHEDMLPLINQVLFLCVLSRMFVHKVADGAAPDINAATERQDKSFEELYQLLGDTVRALEGIGRNDLEGRENEETVFRAGPRWVKKSTAAGFVQAYILPHSFFHISMIYAILRQQGVPLGKLDYITEFIGRLPDA